MYIDYKETFEDFEEDIRQHKIKNIKRLISRLGFKNSEFKDRILNNMSEEELSSVVDVLYLLELEY